MLPCLALAAFGALAGVLGQAVSGGRLPLRPEDAAAGWLRALLGALALAALLMLGGWLMRREAMKAAEKKKFALTARMKRLYAVHALALLGLS